MIGRCRKAHSEIRVVQHKKNGGYMKDLQVKVIGAVVVGDFEEYEKALAENVKRFEIDVTSENLKDAKTTAAALNKMRAKLKEQSAEYLAKLQAPVDEFKKKMKALDDLIVEKRTAIATDISVFEDAKKLEHHSKMLDYLKDAAEKAGLEEADVVSLKGLLPSSSVAGLTSTGDLIKKYKVAIDEVVSDAVAKKKVEAMEAENQRLKDEARANEIVREIEEKKMAKMASAPAPDPIPVPVPVPSPAAEAQPALNPVVASKPKPVYEKENSDRPALMRGKSIYRVTVEYEFIAKSGLDPKTAVDKTLSKFKGGKIEETSVFCKELS